MRRIGGWWRLWIAISGLWVVIAVGIGITIIVSAESAADRMKFSVELACPAPKAWKDVIASPTFRQLAPAQQEDARQQYFHEVVAPQLNNPKEIAEAKAQFDAQYGRQVPTISPPPPGFVLQSSPDPIRVQGPDGQMIEFPGGTSREEMERALQKYYKTPTKPTYKVTAPDRSIYTVTAPEGATQEQVLAYAQAHYQAAKKPTLEQIGEALKRADAAGNTDDARQLAQAYVQARSRTIAPESASTAANPFDQFDSHPATVKLSELNDLDRCNKAKHRDYAGEVSKSRADAVIGTAVGATSLPLILLILGLLTGWVGRGFRSSNAKKQAKP
jgi:hypothetical protein